MGCRPGRTDLEPFQIPESQASVLVEKVSIVFLHPRREPHFNKTQAERSRLPHVNDDFILNF